MKHSLIFFLFLYSIGLSGQKLQSTVEFVGYQYQVLLAKKEAIKATGKLNSGELVKVGCDQGTCFFEIDYKGRVVRQKVGDDITRLSIHEFDFGADGDLELVAINDFKQTSYLYIFSYSRGIIQKLFEKEIKFNKIIISKDYIEYYLPGGLDSIWNFYRGEFWTMSKFKTE